MANLNNKLHNGTIPRLRRNILKYTKIHTHPPTIHPLTQTLNLFIFALSNELHLLAL